MEGLFETFKNDVEFAFLMGAIDMFLVKFEEHELRGIRIGTLNTRYMDCGALMDLNFLAVTYDLYIPWFAEWMFARRLAVEYVRITAGGQEIDKMDSYAPYMSVFNLTPRSPYSISINPNIHIYIHTVGSILGNERCKNARVVGAVNEVMVVGTAIIFGYAYTKLLQMAMQFNSTGRWDEVPPENQAIDLDGEPDAEAEAARGEPQELDAELWLNWLNERGGAKPAYMMEHCYRIWRALSDVRVGTLGALLKKFAGPAPQ